MTETSDHREAIEAALDRVDELLPAQELAAFERVLGHLTELLNAPEDYIPGVG